VLSHPPISGRGLFTVRMKKNGPEERTGQKKRKKEKRKEKKESKSPAIRYPLICDGTDPLPPHLADQNTWTFCFFQKKKREAAVIAN
jgi:hypothetical protein